MSWQRPQGLGVLAAQVVPVLSVTCLTTFSAVGNVRGTLDCGQKV